MKDTETRTLLITKQNGDEIQVDIPVHWKVTFGPAFVNHGPKMEGRIPMALRIYESDKMQRAIFTDVVAFRDLSIPMRIKQVKTQSKDGFMECEGVRKRTTFQATTHEWVNPDEKASDTKQLDMPKDSEMFPRD